MIDAGKLIISLNYAAGKVQQVNIQSTRPLHASRLFIGKTPQQTLNLLPLLFNVCGVAQSFAAFTALSQALKVEENPSAILARQMLVNVEMVREHCWWLLINRDKAKLAPFIQFVNQFKQALFVSGNAFSLTSQLQIDFEKLSFLIQQLKNSLNELFAQQRLSFLAVKNVADLLEWLKNNSSIPAILLNEMFELEYQSLGRTEFCLLPELLETELKNYLSQQNADELSRFPTWQGKTYETSCLNRQQSQPLITNLLQNYGNGLLTRLAGRLCELASLPDILRQNLKSLSFPCSDSVSLQQRGTQNVYDCIPTPEHGNDNMGLAQIQTSRGLLIHQVKLKHSIISHYQLIAPTEWNFHPQGIAALSLQQLVSANKILLQQQATLIINAIDPCVGFEIQIEE